jgi:hypothetical protein
MLWSLASSGYPLKKINILHDFLLLINKLAYRINFNVTDSGYSDDKTDAFWLAQMLRLNILPE